MQPLKTIAFAETTKARNACASPPEGKSASGQRNPRRSFLRALHECWGAACLQRGSRTSRPRGLSPSISPFSMRDDACGGDKPQGASCSFLLRICRPTKFAAPMPVRTMPSAERLPARRPSHGPASLCEWRGKSARESCGAQREPMKLVWEGEAFLGRRAAQDGPRNGMQTGEKKAPNLGHGAAKPPGARAGSSL
jgi:hypothetical protein